MDVLANNSAKFGNIHNPPLEIKDFTAVGKEWAYFRYCLDYQLSALHSDPPWGSRDFPL